jgi:hypothetical protein
MNITQKNIRVKINDLLLCDRPQVIFDRQIGSGKNSQQLEIEQIRLKSNTLYKVKELLNIDIDPKFINDNIIKKNIKNIQTMASKKSINSKKINWPTSIPIPEIILPILDKGLMDFGFNPDDIKRLQEEIMKWIASQNLPKNTYITNQQQKTPKFIDHNEQTVDLYSWWDIKYLEFGDKFQNLDPNTSNFFKSINFDDLKKTEVKYIERLLKQRHLIIKKLACHSMIKSINDNLYWNDDWKTKPIKLAKDTLIYKINNKINYKLVEQWQTENKEIIQIIQTTIGQEAMESGYSFGKKTTKEDIEKRKIIEMNKEEESKKTKEQIKEILSQLFELTGHRKFNNFTEIVNEAEDMMRYQGKKWTDVTEYYKGELEKIKKTSKQDLDNECLRVKGRINYYRVNNMNLQKLPPEKLGPSNQELRNEVLELEQLQRNRLVEYQKLIDESKKHDSFLDKKLHKDSLEKHHKYVEDHIRMYDELNKKRYKTKLKTKEQNIIKVYEPYIKILKQIEDEELLIGLYYNMVKYCGEFPNLNELDSNYPESLKELLPSFRKNTNSPAPEGWNSIEKLKLDDRTFTDKELERSGYGDPFAPDRKVGEMISNYIWEKLKI